MILLLFTSSYPYDFAAEYTFIQPEIPYLLGRFERVILVPRMCKGNRLSLPTAVEVNGDFADSLQRGSKPREMLEMAFSSKCFFQELRTHPAVLVYPSKILKLILFSGRAELTKRWVTNLIKSQQFDPDQCLLYSYWFDHTATGLARIKKEFPRMKLVSRAHGYDLYEEYYYPYYWPYRPETLQALNILFFASEGGRNYYCDRYPQFISKYETAHLGTKDPGFVSKSSEDGVFRVVSCANIVPVKRVALLLDGIAAAARMRPQLAFEWIHFGDGKDRKVLDLRMSRNFPPNARGRLLGNVPNPEVMQHYKQNPVDVFVNVSSTEGGVPVAIQEAISCGIPVVATAVGGNPEVVSEKNGILLNPNPEPREIAVALLQIWDAPQKAAKMKQESRQVWQNNYNAEVNFRVFADRLRIMGAR